MNFDKSDSINLIKVCEWVEGFIVTPAVRGLLIGGTHLLTLTLLIKKFHKY